MLLYVRNALNTVQTIPRGPRQHMGRMLGRIGTNLMFAMIYTALYFKHSAYQSEQEYRYLVATAPNTTPIGMMERPRRSKLIDYLNLDWKSGFPTSLKSIRVGPATDYVRAQQFIRDTLQLHFPGQPIFLDGRPAKGGAIMTGRCSACGWRADCPSCPERRSRSYNRWL
jgi:hypothetical protein